MSCHSTSGGIVSTSLARAVSGLTEKDVQHLFHALKRESAGMASPSELDVAEWRSRQYDLLARMKRMSETRRDKLRDRLFRSRSEPVPDGATFHAWRTIEARTRQEAVLRTIDTAVDLAPPGSQRDLYELGTDGRPARVWYASYGSNLHSDRFMNYIEGGKPEGSTRTYDGCADKTPPTEDVPIRFAGARPHFALTSRVWKGGIAFIDAQKGETAQGLGRAYNVSISQFDDVVAQENGLPTKLASPIPLDEVLTTGRAVIGTGSYETILHIGDYNGAPVLTFTAPFTTREALTKTGHIIRTPNPTATPIRMPVMTNKPSPAYLRMIGGGLNETFGMDETQQADYLRGCPGGDRWTRQQMVRILRGEDPDPPRITGPEEKPTSTTGKATNNKSTSKANKDAHRVAAALSGTPSQAGTAAGTSAGNRRGNNGGSTQEALFSHSARRGNTSANSSTRTGRGAPRRDRSDDDLPNVKTYASVEDQRDGVKRWTSVLNSHIEHRNSINRSIAIYEDAIQRTRGTTDENAPGSDVNRRNLNDARTALAKADRKVTQATTRLNEARAQTPTRYYAHSTARTLAEWQAEDENLIAKHRATETSLTSLRRELAALTVDPNSADADIQKKTRWITKLTTDLREYEGRLSETKTIITSLINPPQPTRKQHTP